MNPQHDFSQDISSSKSPTNNRIQENHPIIAISIPPPPQILCLGFIMVLRFKGVSALVEPLTYCLWAVLGALIPSLDACGGMFVIPAIFIAIIQTLKNLVFVNRRPLSVFRPSKWRDEAFARFWRRMGTGFSGNSFLQVTSLESALQSLLIC